MGWTAGLSRMEPVCDRLFYVFNELSKEAGAPPDVGRAACWIVEQRYPDLGDAERAMLAKFAVAARTKPAFTSIAASPQGRRELEEDGRLIFLCD